MQRYSRIMIATHWATAALVLAAWFTAEGGWHIRSNPPLLHFTFGFAVLLLVVPRLLARWMGGAPRTEDTHDRWLSLAAKAGHTVLYVFLIGLPLSGWYAASRLGVPVSFLGIHLPSIATAVDGYPGLIADLHENAGNVILVLAGLHAAIALWHQFIRRDGTLGRMVPALSAGPDRQA